MLSPLWPLRVVDQVGGVLHDVAWRLGQDHVQVEVRGDVRAQQAIDHDGDVLCSWVNGGEFRHIEIEELVVEILGHVLFGERRQLTEIDHVTNRRVDLARDTNGEFVVVTVAVLVVAFAVDAGVIGIAQRRVVYAVRGIEVLVAEHRDAWARGRVHRHVQATRESRHHRQGAR